MEFILSFCYRQVNDVGLMMLTLFGKRAQEQQNWAKETLQQSSIRVVTVDKQADDGFN
ncbi:MAG: hypothetical protein ACM3MG_10275 [Bacillota bacterium]